MFRYIWMHIRNKLHKTKVKSTDVSFSATVGIGSKIQRLTSVDRHSAIGAHTYIGLRCAIASAQIGRYCSIGNGVSIGLGEHDLSAISTSTLFHRNEFAGLTAKPCRIGSDVWIGADSLILRGVSVGRGAVIGANSVVTKDVAAYEIVVGSPAKHLRYRLPDEKIKQIDTSRWWEKDLHQARETIHSLQQMWANE